MQKYTLLAARILLTLAFGAASLFKLTGNDMMVAAFDTIGIGQWFRYAAALIELGSVVLLWVPGRQFIGAGLMVLTMTGAVLAHLLILGPSAVPAIVLGLLAAYVLYAYRAQSPLRA